MAGFSGDFVYETKRAREEPAACWHCKQSKLVQEISLAHLQPRGERYRTGFHQQVTHCIVARCLTHLSSNCWLIACNVLNFESLQNWKLRDTGVQAVCKVNANILQHLTSLISVLYLQHCIDATLEATNHCSLLGFHLVFLLLVSLWCWLHYCPTANR